MQPNWAFHCVLLLTLPAWKAADTVQVTKSLCVTLWFSHSSEGSRGELLCYFSQNPVTNSLWQAPRRSEQKLLELVGVRSATCPWGWGQGGRKWFYMKASSEDTPLSLAETVTFQGTSKRPWLEEVQGSSDRRRTMRGSTKTGHRSLLTPQLLAKGYSGFHNVPANQVGGFQWENIF